MRFTRFRSSLIFFLVSSALILSSCSPPGPVPRQTEPAGEGAGLALCSQPPDFGLFDLQAASVMQILIGDAELEDLGQGGAEALAGEIFSSETTFCGLQIEEELSAALDEIEALYEAGQGTEADEKLDDLLQSIEEDQFTNLGFGKVSSPQPQVGGARIRRIVRNYLDVSGRAAYWGNDDRAEAAWQAALNTYETWADGAVDSASVKEALRIAAEAQLLGLDDLGDKALERAQDLAELDLMGEIERFEPCRSTREDAGRLLDTAARAQLLGVDTDPYDFLGEVYEWLDIQERREKGEEVPECDLWQVTLVLDEAWDAGYHLITWEGEFKVLEDGALEGQGQGTLLTHVEVPCANVLTGETNPSTTDVEGSFEFQIKGIREAGGESGLFKFLFPAEVSYSGVDTCNEFDPVTYLPAYVIEEIHVSGGVENYDIESDQIYLALPAVDGASQVYETLIGPVEIEIIYLGATAGGS